MPAYNSSSEAGTAGFRKSRWVNDTMLLMGSLSVWVYISCIYMLEITNCLTSWWFQPIWKTLVKLDHFPKYRWTFKKHLKLETANQLVSCKHMFSMSVSPPGKFPQKTPAHLAEFKIILALDPRNKHTKKGQPSTQITKVMQLCPTWWANATFRKRTAVPRLLKFKWPPNPGHMSTYGKLRTFDFETRPNHNGTWTGTWLKHGGFPLLPVLLIFYLATLSTKSPKLCLKITTFVP